MAIVKVFVAFTIVSWVYVVLINHGVACHP